MHVLEKCRVCVCVRRQTSNTRRALAADKIIDNSNVVGAAQTTSSFLTGFNGQLQNETINI